MLQPVSQAAGLECSIEPEGCDEVLTLHSGNHYRLENRTDLAGKTVCIPAGTSKGLAVTDVTGQPDQPVKLVNCGGQVVFDSAGWSNGISILRSRYLHLSGTGDEEVFYGIVQKNAVSIGLNGDEGTSDIEIDHLEVSANGYAGIVVRTYPRCFDRYNRNSWSLRNVNLHHNFVHDVGGEGFYVGTSHFDQGIMEVDQFDPGNSCPAEMAAQAELRHISIHHNRIENTGLDGIQLGAAVEDVEVHDNSIINYAQKQSYGHVGGLQINPGTTGRFFNNWIESGEYDQQGTAIQIAGGIGAPIDIFNNIIIGSPTAILTLGRMGGPDTPLNIIHNTIVRSGSPYFFFCHEGDFTVDYTIKNNIFAGFTHIGDNYWADWSKIFSGASHNCPINGSIYEASNDPDAFIMAGNSYAQNEVDMKFVAINSNDLRLTVASPAVGAGENFLSYAPVDFSGARRTQPTDNGAYAHHIAGGGGSAILMLMRATLQRLSTD